MKQKHIVLSIGLVFVSASAAQTVIYVDADSTGPEDGLTWCTAFTDLRLVLDAAVTGAEIRVAQGTYAPVTCPSFLPCTFKSTAFRAMTFQLKTGVSVLGGYRGCDASCSPNCPDDRDINLYETILTGDINDDDAAQSNPGDPDRDENSYHVVTGNNTDLTAIIDGFTITAGKADRKSSQNGTLGGGMLNFEDDFGGGPTVTRCTFLKNEAKFGAGMGNERSKPVVSDCLFKENFAVDNGGGMLSFKGAAPIVTNCEFRDNEAEREI